MSPNYKCRKVNKKQRRCEAIIHADYGIQSSADPTRFLALLNAGLSTGLTEECVLATATQHGEVTQLLMLPNKSYCFLECGSISAAECIYKAMHNVASIGQNGAIVFLAYFEQLPASVENPWRQSLPAGVVLIDDFVTLQEEAAILEAIKASGSSEDIVATENVAQEGALKHRRVKHFGYEFIYGSNNVNPALPLDKYPIPSACDALWPRLQSAAREHHLTLDWQQPDQLTVNEYAPGHGIPPHVDTHSAFCDPILSLSLLGDVVMDFRRGSVRVPLVLPRHSLLIMSGEARYDWTHGITPRISDVVPTPSGALTTKLRTPRTSLTFRCLRRGGVCNCTFPTLCDTRLHAKTSLPPVVADCGDPETLAADLEQRNVHNIYEQIASHFSETRHTPWPQVVAFLGSFEKGSVVLDIGCGNGKYLNCCAGNNTPTLTIGCDRSNGLLGICAANGRSVFRCDCLQVPVRSQSLDGCISIAVIHHLATAERRLAAVREMARLLRVGGRALIYVWAKNQRSGANAKKSSYLLQNKALNKHKSTEEQQRQQTVQQLKRQIDNNNSSTPAAIAAANLPVHTNRTDFLQQDMLVPWKLKGAKQAEHSSAGDATATTTFLRYYHVFEDDELQEVVAQVPEVTLLQSYYDQGNHCVIFQRK